MRNLRVSVRSYRLLDCFMFFMTFFWPLKFSSFPNNVRTKTLRGLRTVSSGPFKSARLIFSSTCVCVVLVTTRQLSVYWCVENENARGQKKIISMYFSIFLIFHSRVRRAGRRRLIYSWTLVKCMSVKELVSPAILYIFSFLLDLFVKIVYW